MKPNKGVSVIKAAIKIIAVVFGIFWMIMAFSAFHQAKSDYPDCDIPNIFAIGFPLVGGVFAIAGTIIFFNMICYLVGKKDFPWLEIKPDRGSSAIRAVIGIIAAASGIDFIVRVPAELQQGKLDYPDDALLSAIVAVFPLFGWVWVIAGIASVIYVIYNAVSKKRFSWFDVTSSDEKTDTTKPL